MKPLAFVLLFLSSVTVSPARAEADHGRSYEPSTENVMHLQTDQGAHAGAGQPIQVVVPNVGIFPGWMQADAVAVKVPDNARYDLSPEPDFLQFVQPAAQTNPNP